MELWINWRTKITHLTRDCHQIARLPDDDARLERQEGPADVLTDRSRRYCAWCMARLVVAADRAGVVPDADLHPPAERADFVSREKAAALRP